MNPIENIWGVISRRMNVDQTLDINEFRINVLCAWKYYLLTNIFISLNLTNLFQGSVNKFESYFRKEINQRKRKGYV